MSKLLDKDKLWFKFIVSVYSLDENDIPNYLNALEKAFKNMFDESVQFVILPTWKPMSSNNVEVLYNPKENTS